ncbi:homocysteine S-methyltransferase family protein [Marinifilum caeruleilacunae]|uniref:Homocysteine methyltransferase n=1 Tax=Marinifilum caeruleilacunae TaxID=2499076 RepID=A0ABX1WUN9_9BACT|nr:homocysteine S-methyltransferase family protein [Marinifilum caeruleilacunae]NOU59686.1 homocysteine methyltransferase [Marinifilum caeruleilacunae]
MSFEKIYHQSELIVTEAALVERLKSEFNIRMDAMINHAGLIYTNPKVLEVFYKQYINVGQAFDLPIMMMTPTRKVNAETITLSSCFDKDVTGDACKFLNDIKAGYGDYSEKILIGALLGCRGDAYCGDKLLSKEEAYLFHRQQTMQLSSQEVDYLFAGIMPELNEALGMAKAMSETNLPYIISFMLRKDGCLMDGTVLSEAIKMIDNEVYPKPICYMANCIHPTNLHEALKHPLNKNSEQLARFKGIQSNASVLSPEELNNSNLLHQNDFNEMIDEMVVLKKQYGFKILGGCCGTDERFLKSLCLKLSQDV